jgi:hypothetical protein
MDSAVVAKRCKRGLEPSELAAGLFASWLAGGERCEAQDGLREDRALAELLGHRLPGDIAIRGEGFKVYLPLATSLLLSALLSLVLWLLRR